MHNGTSGWNIRNFLIYAVTSPKITCVKLCNTIQVYIQGNEGGGIPACFDFYVVTRCYSSRPFLCALAGNNYLKLMDLNLVVCCFCKTTSNQC